MDTQSKRPASFCTPVDPVGLYTRICDAFGINMPSSPRDIVSAPFPEIGESFHARYLLRELLRKYPEFDLGVDRSAAAISSFLDDEIINRETNTRLSDRASLSWDVNTIFEIARRKIGSILGRFSSDDVLKGSRFGPGATTRLGRKYATITSKMTGKLHVTRRAARLAVSALRTMPSWYSMLEHPQSTEYTLLCPSGNHSRWTISCLEGGLELRDHDTFSTVPKNAVTDRTIGIGPDLNVYLQLGVGYAIRKRLYQSGINLNDQSINQTRAREASISGNLATLDLKSASNSVTWQLVWNLLGESTITGGPDPIWFAMLDALRTNSCLMPDGSVHEYELFSSMGNGYTFELESLIFYALSYAVCKFLAIPADISVYGDDLIVPVEAVSLLKVVLATAGFRLNDSKSFWTQGTTGIFRESCGKHYLDGFDVSPFYVDTHLRSAENIVLLCNNMRRWMYRTGDYRLQPVYDWLLTHLPGRVLRCRIPFGESDDGLISSWDEAVPRLARLPMRVIDDVPLDRVTSVGWRVDCFSVVSRSTSVDGEDGLQAWFYEAHKHRFNPGPSHDDALAQIFNRLDRRYLIRARRSLEGGPSGPLSMPHGMPNFKRPLKEPRDMNKRELKFKTRIVTNWPNWYEANV